MRAPNIILINCDDLGYGDIGCYGSTLNRTPAIDRLADEGLRFTDFYMAPVCSPSRGGMLTGCYPQRVGFGSFEGRWVLFPGQPVGLHPDEVTIGSLLQRQDYATMLIGKWHCGDQPAFLPTRHGFDAWYGLPYSNDMGYMEKYPHYPPLPLMDGEEVVQEQPDQVGLTERYMERAVRFIREHRGRPFFLYLAHMYVHVPLFAPERFLRQSQNGVFGAAVECVDWSTEVLLHELARLGLEEDTLLIFTSDNGGGAKSCNAPLRGGKGTTWEGGIRVPCIMRWPGAVPAGAVCREVAAGMDFLPTFAGLAGTTPPTDRIIDGRDLGPLLRGESGARSPHEAFFYTHQASVDGVRCGRWKLFDGRFNREEKQYERVCELYDLEEDIAETTNVADRHPEIVRDLSARIAAARNDLGDAQRGIPGQHVRPIGRVEHPRTLTERDLRHPYIVASYDIPSVAPRPALT